MLRILTKEVHIQMRNSGVVTIIKWDLGSLLTLNNDSWALVPIKGGVISKFPARPKACSQASG